MSGLTKAQRKDNDRIEAWVKGESFKENSKAKPVVPSLSIEDILNGYTPIANGDGAYLTPPEMGAALMELLLPHVEYTPATILEPCAGIGHLVDCLKDLWENASIQAYELSHERFQLGCRLFPSEFLHSNPLSRMGDLENAYDLVVMNPPFNVTFGIDEWVLLASHAGVTKSEHLFLELATRACHSGGLIGVIAPFNFLDNLPNKTKPWFDERLLMLEKEGPLPGKFKNSNIAVHGYVFRRIGPAQMPTVAIEPVPNKVEPVKPVLEKEELAEITLYQHMGTIDVGTMGSVVWFGGNNLHGDPNLCEIVRKAPLDKLSTMKNWHYTVKL